MHFSSLSISCPQSSASCSSNSSSNYFILCSPCRSINFNFPHINIAAEWFADTKTKSSRNIKANSHFSHIWERIWKTIRFNLYDNRKIWFGFHVDFQQSFLRYREECFSFSIYLLLSYRLGWMGWVRIESSYFTITNDLISLQLFIGFIWRSILPFPFIFFFHSFCPLVLYRCFLSNWEEVIIDCYPIAE